MTFKMLIDAVVEGREVDVEKKARYRARSMPRVDLCLFETVSQWRDFEGGKTDEG